MPALQKIIIVFALSMLQVSLIYPQHPNRQRIDSLKNVLSSLKDVERINCLNALSEEYWWPPKVWPDSISNWAVAANHEATKISYPLGMATSTMHLGVADIYRKNFLTAEKYLRQALSMFEDIHSDVETGWCYLWLGQDLYSQNNFKEAISCYQKSTSLLNKVTDWEAQGKAWAWMSFLYAAIGNYDSSFYYSAKSLQLRTKMSDHVCVAGSLTNIGHLYRMAGAYSDALYYYKQGLQYANAHSIDRYTANWNTIDESMGMIYQLMKMPDSAIEYLEEAIQIDPRNQMTRVNLGETFLLKNNFDSALNIFLTPIDHFRKENNRWELMRVLLDVAKAYMGKKIEAEAFRSVHESLALAEEANVKPYRLEGYSLLSKLYENTIDKRDSALFFLKKFTALKDSVSNDQFIFMLSNYKKEEEFKKQQELLSVLDSDNKRKEEKLKQASLLRWTLSIGLFIAIMSVLFIYRNFNLKRKNEGLVNQRAQSQLKLKASELEMQALRSQMNPHFIFNCLSSINRFILKNETEAASDYLTKFSRLIRIVLTNSKNKLITLEDELEMLRLYLDMERLRFKNSFNYNITFANTIDLDNIYIPPMLLQPFAENAIWHGLMNKESEGLLTIDLDAEGDFLVCIIRDNGIGRKAAAELKSSSSEKNKSMGLRITQERLSLLNVNGSDKSFFEFEDLLDRKGNATGTKVILRIRINELAEFYR